MTLKTVLFLQGLYYTLTAFWPLVHIESFMKVTGHNKMDWLVYTVALMILSSGLVFLYTGMGDSSVPAEVVILSVLNGLSLAYIDIYFSFKKVIRKIYLADAFVEIMIITLLGISYQK